MKSTLLTLSLALSTAWASFSQTTPDYQRFIFSTSMDTYTHLSAGATDMTPDPEEGEPYWDDFISDAITLPFTFKFQNVDVNTIHIDSYGGINFNGVGVEEEMVHISALTYDYAGAPSRGQILYETTGTAGSRIFKIEFKDVSSYENLTGNDTFNFQIWLYEGTNVIEIRTGYSNVPPSFFADGFMDLMTSEDITTLTCGLFSSAEDIILTYDDAAIAYAHLITNSGSTYTDTIIHVSEFEIDETDPTSWGIFDVILLDEYPAEGTVLRYTPISESTGLQSLSAQQFSVYPNPAQNTLKINMNNLMLQDAQYTIYDIYGRSLLTAAVTAPQQEIDVTQLPAGQYILQVKTSSHQGALKFIKE